MHDKDECKCQDLNIYPVKVNEEKLNVVDKYPLPKIPFFMVILGRVAAGKSCILNSLTLSPRFFRDDFQVKILISPTAESDPMMEHMVNHFDFVFTEYSDELLNEIVRMVEDDEDGNRYLLVLDDAINEGFRQSKNGKVDKFSSLITKYRHIKNNATGFEGNLSIILTLQYFRYMSVITRTMAKSVLIAGEIADAELKKISEAYDFFGGSSKRFMELYKKCRINPFDFAFLNVDSLEMRRNFNDEIVYSRKQEYEKMKIKDNEKDENEE
jgi:hypothetical protein